MEFVTQKRAMGQSIWWKFPTRGGAFLAEKPGRGRVRVERFLRGALTRDSGGTVRGKKRLGKGGENGPVWVWKVKGGKDSLL